VSRRSSGGDVDVRPAAARHHRPELHLAVTPRRRNRLPRPPGSWSLDLDSEEFFAGKTWRPTPQNWPTVNRGAAPGPLCPAAVPAGDSGPAAADGRDGGKRRGHRAGQRRARAALGHRTTPAPPWTSPRSWPPRSWNPPAPPSSSRPCLLSCTQRPAGRPPARTPSPAQPAKRHQLATVLREPFSPSPGRRRG
jgi:hypothetical protein